MLWRLLKVAKRWHAKGQALVACYRKIRLRWYVKWHGGQLEIAPSVRLDHPVWFAGTGKVVLEDNVRLGYWMAGARGISIILQPRLRDSEIRIGAGTIVVNGCEFFALTKISIGRNCRIGPRSTIMDADFHGLTPDTRDTLGRTKPVVVEDNVWFGSDVTVLKGITIGRDSVVGAHCVVTKTVPAGSIVVGNPMRVIGSVYEY